jgi:ubiquinone/menaquinone biosynthesis C-methylase UbiE
MAGKDYGRVKVLLTSLEKGNKSYLELSIMERIPEPDLMDDVGQAKAYADADFSAPHDAFVDCFSLKFPGLLTGSVIDLGCGTADVIIRFAKKYPRVHITGIDGARAMLDIARRDIQRAGCDDRIELRECFLPDHGFNDRKFDAVISNSLLHHLADPLVLWETLKGCAKIGAPVFIMDLMRPESEKSARDFMLKYAADESPLLQRDFYNSLLASYNEREIRHQLRSGGLDFLNIEIVSDRHILTWGKMEVTNG